jgi:hypothetical protein
MLTPGAAMHDFSASIARKMTAAADDPALWRHVHQAEPLERNTGGMLHGRSPHQTEAYFDVIMRIRRRRPVRRLHPLHNAMS